MKKIFVLLLSLLTLLSVFAITAGAADSFTEISHGSTIQVTVPDNSSDDKIYVKFIPESSITYKLTAVSDADSYCYLYTGEISDESFIGLYDDENGLDFIAEYTMTAGETYYFLIATYSDKPEEVTLTLEHKHDYTDGICTICNEPCDHSVYGDFCFCPCGKEFLGTDIETDIIYNVSVSASDKKGIWYSFTPEADGTYIFTSENDYMSDTCCELYDADSEWLCIADDNNLSDNNALSFYLFYYFEAGKTYYFNVQNISGESDFDVKLAVATHQADDGSIHTTEYHGQTPSTCSEHGFSEGLYCPDCGIYIYGHEQLDKETHTDDNWDDICDICNEAIVYEDYDDTDTEDNTDGIFEDGIFGQFISIIKYLIELITQFFSSFFVNLL